MTIRYHQRFRRNYKLRISADPQLVDRYKARVRIFARDPSNSLLADHPLTGDKLGYRAFSLASDIRVIYKPLKDGVLFYDVGSHDQVY